MRKCVCLLALLVLPTTACTNPISLFTQGTGISSPAAAVQTPSMGVEDIANQTLVAATMQAVLVQATAGFPLAAETAAPAPPQAENAPVPLPAAQTGIPLKNGECFNFDSGQVVSSPDDQCDVWLVEPALFRQMNSARISGYVTLSPPARTQCSSSLYETGDIAVQTDMFMCFITNQAGIGYIVVRAFQGEVPTTGVILDYWVFR